MYNQKKYSLISNNYLLYLLNIFSLTKKILYKLLMNVVYKEIFQ